METNNQTKNNDGCAAVLGIILIILCVILFFWSFSWEWSSSRTHSFNGYGLNLHHRETLDWSWLKWLFYPIIIIGIVMGSIFISISKGNENRNILKKHNNKC